MTTKIYLIERNEIAINLLTIFFITICELEQCRVSELAQGMKRQHRIRAQVLLVFI